MAIESVGAFEAKTHLSQLLDRVEKGEQIAITRHGVHVATLVPAKAKAREEELDEIFERMRERRKGHASNPLTQKEIREMIEEGRR